MKKDMKGLKVRNYAGFIPADEGEKRYKVILDEEGNEKGIEVRGRVTQFEYTNENGYKFTEESYDNVVANYFEKNSINIPIDLMHERSVRDLAGIATVMSKSNEGITITAFIPKGVYYYGLIKTLIDNGVLQGFSNFGWIQDGYWDNDGSYVVRVFSLISVSLVDVPADSGTFETVSNATKFTGFNSKENEDLTSYY